MKIPYKHSEIAIARDLQWEPLDHNLSNYSSSVLLASPKTHALHGKLLGNWLKQQGLSPFLILIPEGEAAKTLEHAAGCWDLMSKAGLDRKSLVIGFGGGSTCDLAGYVAGCYMRGIDHIFVPTTLLAMVDAAIGGKTAVNLSQVKNLVGLFHHPRQVLISLHHLNTLPNREFCAGIAEIIKYGVIADPDLFEFLEMNMTKLLERHPETLEIVIGRACKIKADIVERDEQEQGLRAILNWGHTIGHALEAATHYTKHLHGEAVAIGLCCEALVSQELGLASPELVLRLERLCALAKLPYELPPISLIELMQHLKKDKKNVKGQISLIAARDIGDVFKLDQVDEQLICKVLASKINKH